jgi:hypothetical protein
VFGKKEEKKGRAVLYHRYHRFDLLSTMIQCISSNPFPLIKQTQHPKGNPLKGPPPKYPRVTHRLHLHLFNPLTHSPFSLRHQLTLDMTATLPEASSSRLDESRYTDIDTVLDRKGGWTEDHFVGGQAVCPLPFPRSKVLMNRQKMH